MSSPDSGEILIYQSEAGETRLEVRLMGETVWLTQKLMAELFQTTSENIGMHLKNIYADNELAEKETTKDFLAVRQEGERKVRRKLKHYNLDAVISVGYRVKSHTATRFRQWATRQLKEYIVKGFILDDERLKNPDFHWRNLNRSLPRSRVSQTVSRRPNNALTQVQIRWQPLRF